MLVKYVGWGGIPQVFDPISGWGWENARDQLASLLGEMQLERHIQACRTGGRVLLLRGDRVRNGRLSAGRRAGGGRDAATGAGARRSDRGRRGRPHRRRAPVQRVEGASPGLLPGGTRARPYVAGRRGHGLTTRPASRTPLQPLLCRSDGDPPGHRGHGPSRDGCRGGNHHRRTSRTGR